MRGQRSSSESWVAVFFALMSCTAPSDEPDPVAVDETTEGPGGSSGGAGESTGEDGTSSDGGVDASTGDETGGSSDTAVDADPVTIPLLEDVVFYDGYAGIVEEPVPPGVVRINNALLATKLDDDALASIQRTLTLEVTTGALCDNYDRIGSVQLALVPKGASAYDPAEVDRIELGRFVTPFMDMNVQPDTVPYVFEVDHIVPILQDDDLLADHDVWFELSVFGVPYAANDEIAGCAGRNDTARGWLSLHSDSSREAASFDVLLPLAVSETFNNYAEGASDAVGTTTKTIPFTLAEDTAQTQLVLITSNHGANAGGEEYNRRDHYTYVDQRLVHMYKPGRDSCEPFRMYNTQGNGIYGPSPKSDEEWQSFSNWCPGDVISTRIIELGAMAAGTHEFVIDVPNAVFADGQGNFPLSLFVQASMQ